MTVRWATTVGTSHLDQFVSLRFEPTAASASSPMAAIEGVLGHFWIWLRGGAHRL